MKDGHEEQHSTAERLFAEFLSNLEDGAPVSFDELTDRNPTLAESLRQMWSDHLHLGNLSAKQPNPTSAPNANAWAAAIVRDEVPPLVDHDAGQTPPVIGQLLGRGGLGEVHECLDPILERQIAIKRIRPDRLDISDQRKALDSEQRVRHFLAEAKLTARMSHPGIAPVYRLGVDHGNPYFTMPKIEGESLHEKLQAVRRGTEPEWSVPRILGVLVRVAATVAYAHDKKVIHRDLKPANVMLGTHDAVYVIDWGLAADLSSSQAGANLGDRVGTPAYMAPEQALGRVCPSTSWDVYAMGAMLYEVLAGAAPYAGDNLVSQLLTARPPSLASRCDASPELVAIVEKAMAHEPTQRYPTMSAVADDLRAYLEGRVVLAYEQGSWAQLRKWMQRNPWLASFAALAVVALFASTLLYQSRETHRVVAAVNSQQASSHALSAAQHAARLGSFESAWKLLGGATDLDPSESVEAELLRIDVLDALGRKPESEEHLRLLAPRTDGVDRARVLVRCALRGTDESGARVNLDLDALEDAANQISVAFGDQFHEALIARAFVVQETPEILDLLDRATTTAPYFRAGFGAYLSLLLITGRVETLREEIKVFEHYFPNNISSTLALAAADIASGDRKGLERQLERVDALLDAPEASALRQAFVGLFDFVRAMSSPDALHGVLSLQDLETLALSARQIMDARPHLDHRVNVDWPNVGSVRHIILALGRIDAGLLESITSGMHWNIPRIQEALRYHQDGFFYYVVGKAQKARREPPDVLRATLRNAISTPTLVPSVARHARVMLLDDLLDRSNRDDPTVRAEIAQHLGWFRTRSDLGPAAELPALVDVAATMGSFDIVADLTKTWVERAPEHAEAWSERVQALLELGRMGEARAALHTMTGLKPPPDDLNELRKLFETRAKEYR